MPSSATDRALRDILYHIKLALQWTTGFDWPAFHDDLRTNYAVTRCLEIISEASRRLPDELKARHSSIAWRQMASAGNIYRHDYEDVAARFVWETVQRDLPPLRAVVEQELARGGSRTSAVPRAATSYNCHAPRKRGIQYAVTPQ